MSTMRTGLIDGDVIAHRACRAIEEEIDWGDGFCTWHSNYGAVQASVLAMLDRIKMGLDLDAVVIALTDYSAAYRKDILAEYKDHRSTARKPLLLRGIREWLVEEHGAIIYPGLEGDDVLGVLSGAGKVVVSIDKDMRTLAGEICLDLVTFESIHVTPAQADHAWLMQSLHGDATDGYGGCPKIGPVSAMKILGTPEEPNYGSLQDAWKLIVKAYAKAGLDEDYAIRQAQCARILRPGDYDPATGAITLFHPSH